MYVESSHLSILVFVTEDWYFWSHRKDLCSALRETGFKITVATRVRHLKEKIRATGILLERMPFRRSLANPIIDLFCCLKMAIIIRRNRPDVVHLVAMKPILISVLSVILFRNVRFVFALAGLGYIFTSRSRRASAFRLIIKPVLRFLFMRKNARILVQNEDDKLILEREFCAPAEKVSLIPGSGVNTAEFRLKDKDESKSTETTIILPARILVEKGVLEFVEAAKRLTNKLDNCRFALVGSVDQDNPGSIQKRDIDNWVSDGYIEWWGHSSDMQKVYSKADIVCLPSYREGLPKSLLEAAACGLPIVATDVTGCRDICIHEQTGLLAKPQNVESLSRALERMIKHPKLAYRYGLNGRKLVEEKFSVAVITRQIASFYDDICHPTSRQV